MRKYKFGNSKFKTFLRKNGFHIALALCMLGVGSAVYVAVNSSMDILEEKPQNAPSAPSSDIESQVNRPVSDVPASSKPAPSSSKVSSQKPISSSSASGRRFYYLPVDGAVIQSYSAEMPVYNKTMDDYRTHPGIDIAGAVGTQVRAVSDGVVKDIRMDNLKGQIIEIDHADGLVGIYCNLNTKLLVKKGDSVKGNQVIGSIGETAIFEVLEKPHLHFELYKNEKVVDPLLTMNKKK